MMIIEVKRPSLLNQVIGVETDSGATGAQRWVGDIHSQTFHQAILTINLTLIAAKRDLRWLEQRGKCKCLF